MNKLAYESAKIFTSSGSLDYCIVQNLHRKKNIRKANLSNIFVNIIKGGRERERGRVQHQKQNLFFSTFKKPIAEKKKNITDKS